MTTGEQPGKADLPSEGYTPKPPSDSDNSLNNNVHSSKRRGSITLRGISLAIILNIIYTVINAYLGLNFGIGLGFGIITVLTAYVLFHIVRGGSSRQEITTTMVASTGFVIYWTLSVSIYIQAYVPGANLPWWLIPSNDVLINGSPFHPAWVPPIIFHLGFVLAGVMLGFITALAVYELVLTKKKSKFPFYLASGVTINTCLESDQQSRFMFKWLGIGVALTITQYIINLFVKPYGLSAISWDFTPFLPVGFALGFMLNISLMAVSYIIDPKVSITMLFAGFITYLVMAPILTSLGVITPAPTGTDFYFNMLFQFSLSPALGIMLLSGLTILGIKKLRNRISSPDITNNPSVNSSSDDSIGFGEYTRKLITGLFQNTKLGVGYFAIVVFFLILAVLLGIFSPFPVWASLTITLILLLPIAIIDVFILLKFVGEAGLGMGAQRLAFYEIPLATAGLYGYVPFLTYPVINPWTATDVIGNLKIGTLTETPKRSILIAQLLKIIPGSITSVIFVLAVWYFIGFPSETFPAVGVLQGFAIVSLFATRSMGMSFSIPAFLLGGTISGLLAAFTPIAPLGIALAMFLPPSYFIPFAFGGFIRLYTERKYGKEWFAKRGQIIAIGFIAGAAITQVIMSFISL